MTTRRRVINPALAGRRVLVVEDEFMIAMLVEETLLEQRCVVLGPYNSLEDASRVVRDDPPDAALLDVNLRGEMVYPLAELLEARGIPFLLLSGYGADAIPVDRPRWRACSKPFSPGDLVEMLAAQIIRRPGAAA